MYQTDLSPVLMTLWVLADSWVQDIEPSNSGLSPLAPSPIVFCFDRGSAFARLSVLLCEPQKHTEKPPATQARMMQLEKSLCRDNDTRNKLLVSQKISSPPPKKYCSVPYLQFHITVHQRMVNVTVSAVRAAWKLILDQRGEFHISHDASLYTILSSFRTHVMLSLQHGRDSWTAVESDLFCR